MREADLIVHLDDRYGRLYSSAVKVAGPFIEEFAPVDVVSNPHPALMMALGPRACTEDTVLVVRKRREDYAKILARQLTAEIIKAMEAHDLRDGYRHDDAANSSPKETT